MSQITSIIHYSVAFIEFVVDTARQEAENYRQQFKRPIPLKVLNERLSNFIHAYTLYSAVRPFGVSIVLASYDKHDGAEMYMIEPSGNSFVSKFISNCTLL